ncbi:MAG: tetratricopeptide repeat protein [Saprospiraceae bacterium]|nr:tetratricopeptide repeat protein [Saprospiraceae bacterium]
MIGKNVMLCFFMTFSLFTAAGQRSAVYTEVNANFKKGLEFFDLGVYGLAQAEFKKVLERLQPVNEPEYRIIKKKAELYYARSAVRLEQPDGEKLMQDFARRHRPDPAANQALLELADYYYNAKKYDEAISFYAQMDQRGFTEEERNEILFRHGYCLFMRKRYDESRAKFGALMMKEGPHYYQGHYYYGMASFYGEDYEEAVNAWSVAEKSPAYRNQIPYYITQIYASQKKYDQVIQYAVPVLENGRVKNEPEMHQLVGQAYFEQGDFQRALPYLEYYEANSRKLRVEDFYQLAFVQYQNKKYEDAIENFKQLDKTNSALGQSAMYYLADSYLKLDDLASARNAFLIVSRTDFDPELQEDALFQYAKLSIQLRFDRDAVNTLRRFLPSSKYYTEAQELLSETLVNTKDYKGAIKIIEGISDQSPRIKEAYQKVTYYQGVQDYVDKDHGAALNYFTKSLSVPINQRIKAMCTFWIGEIHFYQKKYAVSKGDFNQFITLAKSIPDLPPHSSIAAAHYTQGYNYLKTEDYSNALKHFESAIMNIQSSTDPVLNNDILPDAYLRAGDCNFKRNRYNLALDYYNQAIGKEANGFEYALFQKAIIFGLNGRNEEKVNALNQLFQNHGQSQYADDALLELGDTYLTLSRPNDAIRTLDLLVTQYKGRSELINAGYLKLGLITYNEGDIEQALEYYKTIFKNNPSSKEAKDALAAIEEIYVEDLGRPDDYVAFVESIPGYKVSGGEKDSLNYLVAQRLYENAEYERAVEAFSDYLQKYPKGFHALEAVYNRGESFSILRRFNEALSDYESTISRGQSAYYLLALEKAALISYNYAEKFEQAFDFYAKLETLSTDSQIKFDAQMGAMRSAYRIGKRDAAGTYASKVMSNKLATAEELAVAQFYRGKILFENGQYDEALRLFTEVLANSDNENTAEARYLIAEIYYQRKDLVKAEEACRTAYGESSAYPYWVAKSLILLSDVLVANQDFFNARAALDAVIDNFSDDVELVEIARSKIAKIDAEEEKRNRIDGSDDGSN